MATPETRRTPASYRVGKLHCNLVVGLGLDSVLNKRLLALLWFGVVFIPCLKTLFCWLISDCFNRFCDISSIHTGKQLRGPSTPPSNHALCPIARGPRKKPLARLKIAERWARLCLRSTYKPAHRMLGGESRVLVTYSHSYGRDIRTQFH